VDTLTANGTTYTPETDYRLDVDARSIIWLAGGTAPDADAIYGIIYTYTPVYWYTVAALQVARSAPGYTARHPQIGRLALKAPVEG